MMLAGLDSCRNIAIAHTDQRSKRVIVHNNHRRIHVVSVSNTLMIQRWMIAVAAVGLLALCSLLLYARLLNQQAEFMLRTVYELSQQKHIPTLTNLRERFGKKLKQMDGCTVSECGYTVELSSRVLAASRMVPYSEIKSYFWVKNGLVDGTMIDYTTTINRRYSVVSHVQIDLCTGCQTFAIHPWDNSSPLDTNGIVEIGKEASAQNIRTVLSFDTAPVHNSCVSTHAIWLVPTTTSWIRGRSRDDLRLEPRLHRLKCERRTQ